MGRSGEGEQNRNANTRPPPPTRPATAGMASATSASRSVPRPVQWNGLRASQPFGEASFGYTRSFESGASFR